MHPFRFRLFVCADNTVQICDVTDVSDAYSVVDGCNLLVWSSAKSPAGAVVFVGDAFAHRVRRID
jgi:hypothetical protein